jgi:outer membrane receptor protein involved in Fe transport
MMARNTRNLLEAHTARLSFLGTDNRSMRLLDIRTLRTRRSRMPGAIVWRAGPASLRGVTAIVTLAVLFLARQAAGQIGTGTLTGTVVDASTKKAVPDVVVTATSPALQGEQAVVTDASGSFRIPNLPSGSYALRYEADTFHPYSRAGIQLRTGITLRVDAQLLPETLKAEEVTVVARAPTVDVGSARSGVTITSDFTSRLAVAPPSGKGGGARSFEQLAEIAPGVHNDTYGASIAGTTSVENQYMLDGLTVGNPGFGYNGSPLSIDFIKEANIVTGGYLPEYGRGAGGVLDVVTKSGSNEFHGSFFGYYTPFSATPKFIQAQDAISTNTQLDSSRDAGFDLGGPIVKDKLWFYVGADLSRLTYKLTRDLNVLETGADGNYVYDSNGLIVSSAIPGTRRISYADQTGLQYIAKLTYSPSNNDRLELIHHGTPTHSGGNGNYSIDYETGLPNVFANPYYGSTQIGTYSATAGKQIFDSYDTSLKWTHSTPDKKLTFDTALGWHHERDANLAADGSGPGDGGLASTPLFIYQRTNPEPHSITEFENIADPSVCVNPVAGGQPRCPVAEYVTGGPQILEDRNLDRYQLREVVTYVTPGAGHHIIKGGAEIEYLRYSSQKGYPGGTAFEESAGGANVNDFRGYGGQTGPDEAYHLSDLRFTTQSFSFGAFVQDSWAIMDRVTLNVGARYDTQQLYAEGGQLGITLPNQWSPRLGLIFDPTQRGRAKLFVNYAIYYQGFPLDIADRALSGEPSLYASRPIATCTPGTAGYPQSCDAPANLRTINGPSSPSQKWFYLETGKTIVDPDLKPESSSEFSAGGEYEIIPGGRLGLTYIKRWLNNHIDDMSRDEGSTFFIGNPGEGIASDFPKAVRNYDAGTLSFTKSFSEDWIGQASYTLSYLRGNYEGLFRAEDGQLDPGINSSFDLKELVANAYGPLPADHTHEIKIYLARDFPFNPANHLTIGASYIARSGGPTSILGAHPLYGQDTIFILPQGSGDRLSWVHEFDLHVGYTFLETKDQTLSLTADIFNLFNFQAVTAVNQTYTLRPVEPITGPNANNPYVNGNRKFIDPNLIQASDGAGPFTNADRNRAFGSPTAYQQPITMRLGIKATF